VGSRRDCTWILGLPGFRVVRVEGKESDARVASTFGSSDAAPAVIRAGGVAGAPVGCGRRAIARGMISPGRRCAPQIH
jgi:hypothetical protein